MPETDPSKTQRNADSENELLRGDDKSNQVQIKSLYHELQIDKLSASIAEMSEFFRQDQEY